MLAILKNSFNRLLIFACALMIVTNWFSITLILTWSELTCWLKYLSNFFFKQNYKFCDLNVRKIFTKYRRHFAFYNLMFLLFEEIFVEWRFADMFVLLIINIQLWYVLLNIFQRCFLLLINFVACWFFTIVYDFNYKLNLLKRIKRLAIKWTNHEKICRRNWNVIAIAIKWYKSRKIYRYK